MDVIKKYSLSDSVYVRYGDSDQLKRMLRGWEWSPSVFTWSVIARMFDGDSDHLIYIKVVYHWRSGWYPIIFPKYKLLYVIKL